MNGNILLRSIGLVAFTAAALLCAAEEKYAGPQDPASPSVSVDGKEADRQSRVRAALVLARGERIEGELLLPFSALELDMAAADGTAKKSVPLDGIASIEFTRWRGQKRGNNEYVFYHSEVRVTLADRKVVMAARNIRSLNRLRLRIGDRTRSLYSYFYDYRERDAWKNSGRKEITYPETRPHGDTVTRIDFLHEPEAGPLDLFIKGLLKK